MINNRQNGRRRGRGGNGQRQGNPGRPEMGNRIDNRARGNANQLYEKYKNLATEAQRQGDRVNTEYYWQFADHYFRVLSESRSRFDEQNQQRRQRDDFDGSDEDGYESDSADYADEGEPIRAGEQQGDRYDRSDRGANDRNDRGANDRNGARQWEPRGERRPRDDGRGREDQRPVEVAGQRRADPPEPGEALDARAERVIEADAPLPPAPSRGRGRRAYAEESVAVEAALDADRLPPALGIPANANDEAPRPRRRRRSAADDATAAE